MAGRKSPRWPPYELQSQAAPRCAWAVLPYPTQASSHTIHTGKVQESVAPCGEYREVAVDPQIDGSRVYRLRRGNKSPFAWIGSDGLSDIRVHMM